MGGSRSDRSEWWNVLAQLAAYAVLYLVVEADPAKLQAFQMRGWAAVRRGAWWVSAQSAAVGLRAERAYDKVKG
jgi:hypothetical protein